jgi:hypothetical protein
MMGADMFRMTMFISMIAMCGSAMAQSTRPAGPGPAQQAMAKRAGNWILSKKLTMPGQQPMQATGTATIKSILDGRFLLEENEGMLFGRPVAAEMISGYNDETGQYEIVWGWTGSNRLISASGTSSDGGKSVHYTSRYDSGKGTREELAIDQRVIDDDHFVVTLVSKMPDGADGPTVETTYTRQK